MLVVFIRLHINSIDKIFNVILFNCFAVLRCAVRVFQDVKVCDPHPLSMPVKHWSFSPNFQVRCPGMWPIHGVKHVGEAQIL